MFKNKKIAVLIAAAGSGKRMGSGIPKQYLQIQGIPILVKSIQAFQRSACVDSILAVVNSDYLEETRELLSRYDCEGVVLVAGGKERQDSIWNALAKLPEEMDVVLIHDAARPFVSQKIIDDTLDAVLSYKAVVVGVKAKDTILRSKESPENGIFVEEYLKREELYSIQTPQAFERTLILQAYESAQTQGYYGTDDGALVERIGHPVHIVEGDYANYKITTKEDLPMESSIGSGYDVHQLVENRKLILGGIDIPFEKGLLGHSDADVLTHAVMDALLGGAGKGDIGNHFPDTSREYKGISSMLLLKKVGELLRNSGFSIANIDATVVCQRPKIAAYIPDMRHNIAEALEMDEKRINIKGTTTEKLGFVGREEGIAAEAVCLLNR